jgi:SpoVK/Ycf46/Vps4 family AAA+-type ATPase
MRLATADAEKFFVDQSTGLSGADIEAVLIRARMKSVLEHDAAVDADDLKAALEDFIPPSYPTEIEMQNLAAVLECTSRSLLPPKYREMDRAEIARRAKELALLNRE